MESQNIRRSFSIVALALAVLIGAGCQKKDDSTNITVGRDARAVGANGQVATSAGINLNGRVIEQASYQSQFQEAVVALVDSFIPPEYLGFVSVEAKNGTGVFFGGKVELQTGVLNVNNASQANVNIKTDSKLLIAIYDEFTGRPDASGKNVGPIAIYITQASGYVQGQSATLRFNDPKYGWVSMEGTFNNSTFEGYMHFDNRVSATGSSPMAGDLGYFQVATCQFFRCQ